MARRTEKAKANKRNRILDDIDSHPHATSNGTPPKLVIAVTARNPWQKAALKAIHDHKVTFIFGPPGTGKTALSTGYGIQELIRGRYDKFIITRPAVEAGETLGFLPGSFDDKLAPYLMPMYDVLSDYFNADQIKQLENMKKIVTLPIGFQRGITYKKSFVLVDEAQNSTIKQMQLILTRLGPDSKIVVTGDVFQSDLRGDRDNGLMDAIRRLQGIEDIAFVELDYRSNCREGIVSTIDKRYRKDSSAEERLLPQIMKELYPNYVEKEDPTLLDFDEYRDID